MTISIEKRRANHREYYYRNKDKIISMVKRYRSKKENKDKINSYRRNKRKTNSNYRIKRILITRLGHALKGNTKSASTMCLLGCRIDELKTHLQNSALLNGYKDFDIDNYSGKDYHVDHIIPCDSFNLKCSYHQKLCFNYSNLQILKSDENIRKFNKLNGKL